MYGINYNLYSNQDKKLINLRLILYLQLLIWDIDFDKTELRVENGSFYEVIDLEKICFIYKLSYIVTIGIGK